MRRHVSRSLLATMLVVVVTYPVLAQLEANPVLHIGHLDFDGRADTVIGALTQRDSYFPSRILWGRDTSRRRSDTTSLQIPGWRQIGGSAAFLRLNADTLDDIVLFMIGKDRRDDIDHDTVRTVAIFGQSRLKNINQINVNSLRNNQTHPFFSLDLMRGGHLSHPARRDYSGQTSYELLPVTLNVRDTTTEQQRATPAATNDAFIDPSWIRVYPNPAVYATSLEAENIKPGGYLIRLVGVNGIAVAEQRTTVNSSGQVFETLALDDVPTGYYELQLIDASNITASFPVVVVH